MNGSMNIETETDSPESTTATLVRLVGIVVLAVGLLVGLLVLHTAWNLLQKPETILPFAQEIETRSQLNAFVHGWCRVLLTILREKATMAGTPEVLSPQTIATLENGLKLDLSYFAAWGLTVMVLLLIGRIAFWTLSTGAQAALASTNSERQIKRIVRELMREMRSEQAAMRGHETQGNSIP
jgi:hypothetical protein